jgi:hypothetical protein
VSVLRVSIIVAGKGNCFDAKEATSIKKKMNKSFCTSLPAHSVKDTQQLAKCKSNRLFSRSDNNTPVLYGS